jgi:hypothetical protein
MKTLYQILRKFAVVLMIALCQSAIAPATVSAIDQCEDVCTLSADCSTDCMNFPPDMPGFQTTCGNYNGGVCGDTCDVTCTPDSPGSTACQGEGGSSTTCGSYGISLTCGDGFCAVGSGESCNSCSADCGACLTVTENDRPSVEAMADDISSAGAGNEGTTYYAIMMADYSFDYGWFNEGYYSDPSPSFGAITCEQKSAMLAAADALLKDLNRIAQVFSNLWMLDMATQTQNAINAVQHDRDTAASTPCLLH